MKIKEMNRLHRKQNNDNNTTSTALKHFEIKPNRLKTINKSFMKLKIKYQRY